MNRKRISTMLFLMLLGFLVSLPKLKATDGWTKYSGNPVLDIGSSGSWDDHSIGGPTVLWKDGSYKMWYYGGSNNQNLRVGFATSSDGQVWTRYVSNPVLNVGPSGWDSFQVSCPSVIFNGSHYCMWYSGNNGNSVGLATSNDGVSWTKYPGNPVFSGGRYCSVLFESSIYKMWYEGYDYTINYATSTDGISWTNYGGNPVLVHGLSGAWDGMYVSTPSVAFNGSHYIMSFGGYQNTMLARRIGLAYSTDGVGWSKDVDNPIIDVGLPGSWEDTFVDHSGLLFVGSSLKMWYSGFDGTETVASPTYYYRIGLATFQYPNVGVGGEWVPTDIRRLLAPWISSISLIAATAISFVFVKRKEKEHDTLDQASDMINRTVD